MRLWIAEEYRVQADAWQACLAEAIVRDQIAFREAGDELTGLCAPGPPFFGDLAPHADPVACVPSRRPRGKLYTARDKLAHSKPSKRFPRTNRLRHALAEQLEGPLLRLCFDAIEQAAGEPRAIHALRRVHESLVTLIGREKTLDAFSRRHFAAIDHLRDLIRSGSSDENSPVLTTPSGSVKLFGEREPSIVDGVEVRPLRSSQYHVIAAILESTGQSLAGDALVERSGHTDAVGILKRLAERPPWSRVIRLPGKGGESGYAIL